MRPALLLALLPMGCSDQTLKTFNSDPTALIVSPSDGQSLTEGRTVAVEGVVGDDNDAVTELRATWRVDGVQACAAAAPDAKGGTRCELSLDLGSHELALVVEDPSGGLGSDTATVQVQASGAPSATIAAPVEGAALGEGQLLSLEGAVSDLEDGASALTVWWTVDGVETDVSSTVDSDGSVHGSTTLVAGEHALALRVQDTDGKTGSDSVTVVVATPPEVLISAPDDGVLVQQGQAVDLRARVTDSRDADDTLAVTWSSDLDGVLGSGSPDSGGDLAVRLEGLSWGTHVLTVQATDSAGLSASDRVGVVVNAPPSAPVVLIGPASPLTADTLSASLDTAAVDPEGATLTTTWAWTRDGSTTSYTGSTVPSSATSRGQTWQVSVTASDPVGGTSAAATASVSIGNTPPVLSDLAIFPAAPTVDDSLSLALASSDVDGDAVSYRYRWTVDGVSAGTASTLAGAFVRGQVVQVTVTPGDGTDDGAAVSDSVTVVNSPPTPPVLSISPDPAFQGDALGCSVDTPSTDADGDPILYSYAWTVDGASAGISSDAVPIDTTGPGELWACRVTPSDGTASGTPGTASITVLGNPVDYAHIQYPCSLDLAVGTDAAVYGWVYQPGVTDAVGRGTGITAELGWGDPADDPTVHPGRWTWVTATYNTDKDGLASGDLANDEYVGTLTASGVAGSYAYAFRFSTDDGASWTYADLGPNSGCGGNGTLDGFDVADAGLLTVSD